MIDIETILRRLRGRADVCESTARTYDASGYHGEALLQRARAAAYRCAVEDVVAIAGAAVHRGPLPKDVAEVLGFELDIPWQHIDVDATTEPGTIIATLPGPMSATNLARARSRASAILPAGVVLRVVGVQVVPL
jgi:hypothetical protein